MWHKRRLGLTAALLSHKSYDKFLHETGYRQWHSMTQHSAPQKEWRKQRTSAKSILPQKESKHTGSIKIYNKIVRYRGKYISAIAYSPVLCYHQFYELNTIISFWVGFKEVRASPKQRRFLRKKVILGSYFILQQEAIKQNTNLPIGIS